MNVKTNKEITIKIGLDANNIPVQLNWKATDDPNYKECKAMLLSLFDKNRRDTLKVDLWTSELQVNEMDRFMFQTLRGLADTYFNATKNNELASAMQQFANYFGEQTEILPKRSL